MWLAPQFGGRTPLNHAETRVLAGLSFMCDLFLHDVVLFPWFQTGRVKHLRGGTQNHQSHIGKRQHSLASPGGHQLSAYRATSTIALSPLNRPKAGLLPRILFLPCRCFASFPIRVPTKQMGLRLMATLLHWMLLHEKCCAMES